MFATFSLQTLPRVWNAAFKEASREWQEETGRDSELGR